MFYRLTSAIDATERFFDRIKLGYKRRFNRFTELSVLPLIGYVADGVAHLSGRVLDDHLPEPHLERGDLSAWHNAWHAVEHFDTDEVAGARVRVTLDGRAAEVLTDDDGFFRVSIPADISAVPGRRFVQARVEVLDPPRTDGQAVGADIEVLVPGAAPAFAILSDMDDTVVVTGATDKIKFAKAVLLNSAATRTPFEGIGAFYHALVDAEGAANPIFYVSSSPVNLFAHFLGFLRAHRIPEGPMFLKNFGFAPGQFIKTGHDGHKLARARTLRRRYPGLPFVLVGDSGQRDPEIYAALVEEAPDRVRAVYLRDVNEGDRSGDVERRETVQRIAQTIRLRGVPCLLAADTVEMARHAAEHGLVPADAVAAVEAEAEAFRARALKEA